MRSQWIFRLSLFTLCNIFLFMILYYQPRIPFRFIVVNQSISETDRSSIHSIDQKPISSFQSRLNRRWFHLGQHFSNFNLQLAIQIQNTSQQTLTYSCTKYCGGWGDRLRGLTSTYLLAVFLRRRFQIDMSYPCEITSFLRPNFIDWRLIIHRNKSLQLDTIHRNHSQLLYDVISRRDIHELLKNENHIYLTTNTDYISPLLKNPHFSLIRNRLNFSSKHLTQADLFPLIFEILFQPTRIVLNQLDRLYENSLKYASVIVCLHIRLGQNPTVPKDMKLEHRDNLVDDMIKFVDRNLSQIDSSIFVTSDSLEKQMKLIEHFGSDRVIVMDGPIIHIDRFNSRVDSRERVCQGFLKVIVDFYFLGECDITLKPRSGFSEWANHRRLNEFENFYFYCRGFHRVNGAQWRRPHAIC